MITISYEVNHDENPEEQSHTEVSKLLKDIEESTGELNTLVDNLKVDIKSGKLNTKDGISLLDVKNQMMINYISNVVYIIAKKLHGNNIEGDGAIERLVEMRTVLERIRPLEQKLKYMMEKLVKTALTGAGNENDPTHFRANPENMAANMAGSESESEEDETPSKDKSEKKPGVYVPPRVAPMHYEEEENAASRRQKLVERARKRALHSSVMEELREEYLDTPAEVTHSNVLKQSLTKQQRFKNRYEEEYFTRLPTMKKDRHKSRYSMTVGNIGDQLTHFEDIQVLEDEAAFQGKMKGKRKSSGKADKKKAFKRRRTR
ncbi:neuroguidin [Macrosteles quadrilineatus]|uniref:neuroguidin n=1 Tax=Macrosteles quadrilineatus TaxID=74068 RepID=UPI0023E16962|nr:neuroguidin [Macrosteles quadrilineatus]